MQVKVYKIMIWHKHTCIWICVSRTPSANWVEGRVKIFWTHFRAVKIILDLCWQGQYFFFRFGGATCCHHPIINKQSFMTIAQMPNPWQSITLVFSNCYRIKLELKFMDNNMISIIFAIHVHVLNMFCTWNFIC